MISITTTADTLLFIHFLYLTFIQRLMTFSMAELNGEVNYKITLFLSVCITSRLGAHSNVILNVGVIRQEHLGLVGLVPFINCSCRQPPIRRDD